MVLSCCAVGCKNRAGRGSVSFYCFPANQELREKWIAAVKRDGWQPTPYTRLCSDHFAKGHRDSNPLSPNFVPSIFHHTPTSLCGQYHGTEFCNPNWCGWPRPFPGVVDMFGGSVGLLEYRSAQLASRGFASLALAFFGYEDLPKSLEEFNITYFEEAVEFLLKHEKVCLLL
ncbi:hypothetical protein Pcinc_010634 [Petrolisthes cinctipes]|uniref:THAP-type domain-containing protein n=1 Tax=Petrolisthes cinctipes TaxID=88211 RepID=A0AAE1G8N6_PETCI|nr:hypothetical protein Pcinc_010634 [Petrolisthes cinctipes]